MALNDKEGILGQFEFSISGDLLVMEGSLHQLLVGMIVGLLEGQT